MPEFCRQKHSVFDQHSEIVDEFLENDDLSISASGSDLDSDSDSDDCMTIESLKLMSKEELAAANLTWFYCGRIPQAQFGLNLELQNVSNSIMLPKHISNSIKLPTSFDGIVKVLYKEKKKFIQKKIWYCGICLKTYLKNQINHGF